MTKAPARRHARRSITVLLAFALLTLPALALPAAAVTCAADAVPAATLLLPYFEVSLADPEGLATLFAINNASPMAVLAHVVVWTDLAVPVLGFDVYLTGYDVQTINLRDVIMQGVLPQTASVAQDPADTISPRGPLSQDIPFGNCDGFLPPRPLPPSFLAHLQNALSGRPSQLLGDRCAGQNLGDSIARGYVTIDTVSRCTDRMPGDPGYFGAGNDVTDQNVLWGVWYIVNSARSFAQASTMVAIEADGTNPATSTPGRYTFYGRYVGWSAADHREPLATSFAVPYADGGVFTAGTDLIVWRDPKTPQGPVPCPAIPGSAAVPWYPLTQEGLGIFDEREQVAVPTWFPIGGPPVRFTPFPAATQRVAVNSASFPVPFTFGWLDLDLNAPSSAPPASGPPIDPRAAQAWVVATESANGRFAVTFDAYRLDSACAASHAGATLPLH